MNEITKTISKTAEELTKDVVKHSPIILTTIGCVGVVGTGMLSAAATPKAMQLLALAKMRKGAELTLWEKVKVASVVYIPAAVVAGATITSIISSNHISTTRLETMAAAYQISETARKAYQEKVLEEVGPKKEEKIRSEVAKDRIRNNPPEERINCNALPSGKSIEELAKECRLLYEGDIRGMYFEGSSEKLKSAEREIQWRCENGRGHCASLNEFYELIGLTDTEYGNNVGFNNSHPCVVNIYPVYLDEDKGEAGGIVTEFNFLHVPVPNYDEYLYDEESSHAPWECH